MAIVCNGPVVKYAEMLAIIKIARAPDRVSNTSMMSLAFSNKLFVTGNEITAAVIAIIPAKNKEYTVMSA